MRPRAVSAKAVPIHPNVRASNAGGSPVHVPVSPPAHFQPVHKELYLQPTGFSRSPLQSHHRAAQLRGSTLSPPPTPQLPLSLAFPVPTLLWGQALKNADQIKSLSPS